MTLKINSEIGKLKAAMMQPPGKEIQRLTPSNMKSLLWDNLPWAARAAEEHQAYVKTMHDQGIKVHIMSDLLKEVIKDGQLRRELIDKSVAYESGRLSEQTLETMRRYMVEADDNELIDIFTGGMPKTELYRRTHEVALEDLADPANEFCMTPMTNIGWPRDPAVVIGNGVAFSVMYGRAKAYACDVAVWVTNKAMELMGSYGYSFDYNVEKYLRDVKILQLWLGGPQRADLDTAHGHYKFEWS